MTRISCGLCPFCEKVAWVDVHPRLAGRVVEYLETDRGARTFVQHAFPSLSAGVRETILTGTHEACWDRAFSDE